MRRAGLTVVLVACWCLLWGSVTPADVVGGLLATAVVLLLVPDDALPAVSIPRPLPTARFALRFTVDLVVASVTVARQAFWRRGRLRPRVVEVQLTTRDPRVLTVVGNAITLTPGTLTLEIDPRAGTLLVHALHSVDGHEVGTAAGDYERLVTAMLGAQEVTT